MALRRLHDPERAGLERVAGYHPLGSEISPLLAMEEARAVGAIAAFPCFANPAKPFRFLAGDPLEPGPFGIMQPATTETPANKEVRFCASFSSSRARCASDKVRTNAFRASSAARRSDSFDSGSIPGLGCEGSKGGDGTTMAVCPKIL
jgi:hypothetical protein